MDDGSFCYFNAETQTCVEIGSCDSQTCSTICIHEVENTCDTFSNSTHQCSCRKCPGVTECQSVKTELLHFDEDFSETFPTTEKETEFLAECSSLLDPVQCMSVVSGSIYLQIAGESSAVDAVVSDISSNGLTVPGFDTWNLFDNTRSGLATGDDGNSKLGAIWITIIIVLVCLCILGACFVRHYSQTPKDYAGGATPKAKPAVLEMDGKKMDFSDATYGNADSDEALEANGPSYKVYVQTNSKKGPPLPPRPVSSVNVPSRNRGTSNV